MLKNVRTRLDSWYAIIIFGIIYVVSQVIIALILEPVGAREVFGLQTSFSASVMRDTLETWRTSGVLNAYQQHFIFDFPHPIWYALALMAGLSKGFNALSVPDRYNVLLLAPLVGGLCDLFENISHQFFMSNVENITSFWVALSAAAAWLKWFTLIGSLLAVIVMLIVWLVKKIR